MSLQKSINTTLLPLHSNNLEYENILEKIMNLATND